MHSFTAYFTAEEALIISDGTSEGMKHTSLAYIPGSMLLGALATLWREKHHGQADEHTEFQELFLQEKTLWGHAVPICDNRPCVPVPHSWQYVKNKGRLPIFATELSHTPCIFNLLRAPDPTLPTQENTTHYDKKALALWKKETEQEHSKRKNVPEGFVDTHSFCAPHVQHQRHTHVAMDTLKRSAADGQLFAYQAIQRGTQLCSRIFCTPEQEKALCNLLTQGLIFYVGHARSAGYGAVRLTALEKHEDTQALPITTGEHVLFLTSDYFPKQSWKAPLQGLYEEIATHLHGTTWLSAKSFCKDTRLESFNGLWKLPRATRFGIRAGSVLTFTCPQNGTLPPFLGAWSQEGYGRFLLNPPLLQNLHIEPQAQECSASPQQSLYKATTTAQTWHFFPVWRRRSLERIAHAQALYVWEDTDLWKRFFKLLKDEEPTQSQRGNIRRMVSVQSPTTWVRSFQEMLGKTPGKQWKEAVAYSPFVIGRESLDSIMLQFFNIEICTEMLQKNASTWDIPKLAGGTMTPEEENFFQTTRHKRFILELLRRWEKEVRTTTETEAQ